MSTAREGFKLRKAGQHAEALAVARALISEDAKNRWNRSLLGWCLYDTLKAMDPEQPASMAAHLSIRDEVIRKVLPHIEKPSLTRSLLLFQLARLGGKGTFFHILRAGLNDFRPEDYEPGISPNSPKPFPSQVESLAGHLHKALKPAIENARLRPAPGSRAFRDLQTYHRWLGDLERRFPRNAHLIYYRADTELVLGQSETALGSFETLAMRIPRQAWVWTKLAMAYPGGSETRLDAMLKAFSLYRPNDPYAVSLLSDLARELPDQDPAAKYFLERSSELRAAQSWPVQSGDQGLLRRWEHLKAEPLSEEAFQAAAKRAEHRVGLVPAKNARQESFVGKLNIPEGREFGFVGEIHLPARLIRTCKLKHGETVAGIAESRLDPKKNRPGWIAVRIHKALKINEVDSQKRGGSTSIPCGSTFPA